MKFLNSNKQERVIIDLSEMGFKNVVRIGHYAYRETKNVLEMHQHFDQVEICFLESGSQYYQVGDDNYFLEGGDVMITPPDVVHGTRSQPERKGSLFWLIINTPKPPFKLLNLTHSESEILTNRLLNLKEKHFKGSSDMKKIMNSIFSSYYRTDEFLKKIEISNQILNFLLEVIRSGEINKNRNLSPDIEYCCKYIDDNTFKNLYVNDLAEKLNLSESRFKHKFKEQVGTPPNEYIIKRKIKKVKELLLNSNVSITNIAYDLGFSTSSYFSTVFKKYEGVSPSEYINLSSIKRYG